MRNPNVLRSYVVVVALAGIVAVIGLPAGDLAHGPWAVLAIVLLTGVSAAYPVRMPTLRVQFSIAHTFVFYALAAIGPVAAVLASVSGAVGGSLRMGQQSARLRFAFNLGSQALSTALAGMVFLAAGGNPGRPLSEVLIPLALGTLVYFVANTGLISIVLALERSRTILDVWRESFLWSTASYFTGLTLAACTLALVQSVGLWGVLLAVPPSWMMLVFYQAQRARLEEHELRIREVEALNAALEQKVAERTAALKEAFERIEVQNRELLEASDLKENLTQMLVHDLKNPLTSVIGNLQLLERKVRDEHAVMIARSVTAAQRMHRMVLDLLDIAGLEEGRLALDRRPLDARRLLQDAVEDADVEAQRRGVVLRVDPASTATTVDADAAVLRRVVDNLIANALEHSPSGTTVTLSTHSRGGDVELSVADQGPGIPEEYRDRVFEKFSRFGLRRTGITANRGLGLTFCRLAVEAHGGAIWVESAPGGGALFRTVIPANVRTGALPTSRCASSA